MILIRLQKDLIICFFQEEEGQVPRKRRPGVSDSIIPTKKAMDFHKRVYNTSN